MADKDPNINEEHDQTQLQEEYLKTLDDLEEGQLIEGNVVEVGPEHVFVDVGYKSEGKIPLEEFEETPDIGDDVSVVLVRKEGKNGQVVVSKQKADAKLFWKNLRDAFQDRTPVEGSFATSIKGGYEVDLGHGIRAFNPLSKADVTRVQEPESLVGTKSKFLVERLYSDGKVNIVVSRRSWLEEEMQRRKAEFFSTVSIGDEVEGTVKSFTSFGAFIDLGGFDGLLHINDMSWGHVTRPKDYVKKGQVIQLKVIRMDPEEQKINLSLKHFSEDPWSSFETRYQVDDVVKGRVTKLTDFGAFIELEEGIEGLAHISELSWVRRIQHPREVLQAGDEVDVKILGYDIQQGRVSLGLKQVYANPWETLENQYPVGMRITCVVRKLTNAGAFLELEEGIDGFLHVDDMSWTRKPKHPSAMLEEGQEVEVMVIDIDKENHRVRLGLKQLSEDPWQSLAKAYPRGSIIEGEVTSVTDFGVFVRVQGDIEGLVNKANLTEPHVESQEEALQRFRPGEKVTAVVTDVSPGRQRLSLSIRELVRQQQRQDMQKYIHDDEEESTTTLGDILKQKGNEPLGS